jgi:hypothetical protein
MAVKNQLLNASLVKFELLIYAAAVNPVSSLGLQAVGFIRILHTPYMGMKPD